jgi:hypothetical protein
MYVVEANADLTGSIDRTFEEENSKITIKYDGNFPYT